MKTPIVFSLVREQSLFMTAIMSLLTFLSVLALGIGLAIGTGISRWNAQWKLFATVQVMDASKTGAVKKILDEHQDALADVTQVSSDEMETLLRPWVTGGGNMKSYLPVMYELRFKNESDLKTVGDEISKSARFLTHASSLRNPLRAGVRLTLISVLVLALTLGAIGICISFIARNTAQLHRRELEILNQIGARDSFVARQMQIIVGKICTLAGIIGFVSAAPILLLIIAAARSARVGLMATLALGGGSWVALMLMPVMITIFAIWITRRTTLAILKNNQ